MAFFLSPPPNDVEVKGPAWKQWFFKISAELSAIVINLVTDVTGILNPNNGGTGVGSVPDTNDILIGNASGT